MLRLERRREEILSTKSVFRSVFLPFYRDKRSRSNRNSCYSIIPVIRMRDVCARDSFFHLRSFARRSFPREMADSRETIQRVAASGEKVFRNQRSEIKRQQQRGVRQNNGIGEERWENIGTSWKSYTCRERGCSRWNLNGEEGLWWSPRLFNCSVPRSIHRGTNEKRMLGQRIK